MYPRTDFRQIVKEYLAGVIESRYYHVDVDGRAATIGVHTFGISGPGGTTLFSRSNVKDGGSMGLDLLYDYPDSYINGIRVPLLEALEKLKVSVIPVSYNALYRLSEMTSETTLRLVDRIGLECVFTTTSDRYYISGYDRNETPPLYFLARLPGPVKSCAEAIESLKPQSVKLAEAQGLEVLRQGDMFAIATPYTAEDLLKMDAIFPFMPGRLYGTAHIATNAARLPDGTMFGQSSIIHAPTGTRRADHHPLIFPDDKWYLIVKNTVPVMP